MQRYIILFLLISSISLFASFDDYEPSARARAMGGAFYTTSNDADAVFYNPAGLMFTNNGIKINHTNVFNNDFQKLTTIGFSMQLPKKFGVLGIGLKSLDVTYEDVTLTSEKTYSISHAFTLMKDYHSELHFGYNVNLYNLTIHENGDQNSFGFDLAAMAILHQRTRVAFTVTNVNNPKVGKDSSEELPQKLAMGLAYEPYTGVITAIELKKSFDREETEIHAGTEFEVFKILTLRAGVRNHPTSYSMGAGFKLKNITIDYGFSTHEIGNTHHFALGFNL